MTRNILPIYWPFVKDNPLVTCGFPYQRPSNVELWCFFDVRLSCSWQRSPDMSSYYIDYQIIHRSCHVCVGYNAYTYVECHVTLNKLVSVSIQVSVSVSISVSITQGMQNGHSHALTHRGRVTHIYVDKLTIIASDNRLAPGRRQAIIWPILGYC